MYINKTLDISVSVSPSVGLPLENRIHVDTRSSEKFQVEKKVQIKYFK